MPRLIAALPFLALAALGACHQQSTESSAAKTGEVTLTNASPEEVAKQAQAAGPLHFSPGQWETKVEVAEVDLPDMPDMPPQFREKMTAAMKQVRSVKSCMTKEEAEKPGSKMFTGDTNGRCTYDHFTMASGQIDAKMTCKSPRGATMTQAMRGTYTATSFALSSEVDESGGPGGKGMHMKAKVNGVRIGACTGKES